MLDGKEKLVVDEISIPKPQDSKTTDPKVKFLVYLVTWAGSQMKLTHGSLTKRQRMRISLYYTTS